jgi:glycopeptide antibiotics resistance protein
MINIFTNHGNFGFAPDLFIKSSVIIPIFLIIAIGHTVRLVRGKSTLPRIVLVWTFYIYLYTVASITQFPISWFNESNPLHRYSFGQQYMVTLNPISWINNSKFQIIGNVLLLVPLTLIGGLIFPRMRTFLRSAIIAFGFSLGIELVQLIMSYFYLGNRVFDVGDLLLNTTGGLIGYGLLVLLTKAFSQDSIARILKV